MVLLDRSHRITRSSFPAMLVNLNDPTIVRGSKLFPWPMASQGDEIL